MRREFRPVIEPLPELPRPEFTVIHVESSPEVPRTSHGSSLRRESPTV
jgi:hypothetical protein